ncbi:MAG TPA: GNAT family N-acetyltransferase [Rhizomicrobium sp.]|jgi:GNAT superfamily N-acetyltransferase|nr:GNAT family N-acetyltransferase [Rhizomicrobium sp.]
MQPVAATADDIASWLELARQVEPLFGPMPLFDVTLRTKIAEGAALCVREGAVVLGGILLGGEAPDHWIRWLAVRTSARGHGAGAALLGAALARMPSPCTVSLATFGADIADGRAARRLYARFGFVAGEMLPRGPEGGSRQRFTLARP